MRRSRPGPAGARPGPRPAPPPARASAARTVPASRARGPAASRSSAAGPAPASTPTTRSPGSTAPPASAQRDRQDRLRAEGRRGPGVLEPARHQRRGQQVLPRPRRHAGARAQRQAADRPRRQHDRRLGRDPALLRHGRGPRRVPGRADPPPGPPEDGFNSPVWFNVGIEAKPQCSACFINSVQDNMSSIMDLAKTEAMLFKYGSGAGVNLSPIRSSKARMSGGGIASGPVSFMRGYDAFAGVIKSGGKTRRAAKMVILDVDHPDVIDFIDSKALEEKQGLGAHRAGLRPLLHRRGLRQRLLPERQPQRPRDRRVHARGRARRRVADPRGHRRPAGRHATRPATSSAGWPTRPTSAATRASSTTPPSTTGTRVSNSARQSTRPTRASRATRWSRPTRAGGRSICLVGLSRQRRRSRWPAAPRHRHLPDRAQAGLRAEDALRLPGPHHRRPQGRDRARRRPRQRPA